MFQLEETGGIVGKPISIVWFRQDLRLSDHEALAKAAQCGEVLPVFLLDEKTPKAYQAGDASRVWLHYSLQSLNKSMNDNLNFYTGDAKQILVDLVKKNNVTALYCNQSFEPWQQMRDESIAKELGLIGVSMILTNSNYLWSPDQVLKDDGSYYKVFTPFKKKTYSLPIAEPIQAVCNKKFLKDPCNKTTLADLSLLPAVNWYDSMLTYWKIGEKEAHKKLEFFMEHELMTYKIGRDNPSAHNTSRLSPHLHFGEISPRQICQALETVGSHFAKQPDIECYFSELTWREFSAYLFQQFPKLSHENFNPKFNRFPWENNARYFNAWKRGQTGYPLVDAGMRELWQTGYMHNRVRMVVASFLVKNLLIHWHKGRDWFWDCLFDADLANNSASWQWVAGCGADAAPYFRIFNPTIQGEKFDPQGFYTRQYVPELKDMPDNYLYKPWEAPPSVLESASVILGKNYPKPIVDWKTSREAALAAYQHLN